MVLRELRPEEKGFRATMMGPIPDRVPLACCPCSADSRRKTERLDIVSARLCAAPVFREIYDRKSRPEAKSKDHSSSADHAPKFDSRSPGVALLLAKIIQRAGRV